MKLLTLGFTMAEIVVKLFPITLLNKAEIMGFKLYQLRSGIQSYGGLKSGLPQAKQHKTPRVLTSSLFSKEKKRCETKFLFL